MRSKTAEFVVGLFILAGIAALALLAFKVSGTGHIMSRKTYEVNAVFDNVGGLKPRATVSLGGVEIGQVKSIQLDPDSLEANVTLSINQKYNAIPDDSTPSILTQGLLGANYIGIIPGADVDPDAVLKQGSKMMPGKSAMILENLIGQLIYGMKSDKKDDAKTTPATITSQ